jgi:fructose-bisphosphate aldolase/2-amino-3,7-dideoxy-D-threo-hept-6-ulosonate synthase
MTEIGKKIRIDRIMDRNTRKTVIIPMDHGIALGPIKGLENMKKIVNQIAEGGANAILEHKGIIRAGYRGYGRDIGLIMHLSASTDLGPDPDDKVLVAKVEEAIKLGADAVSIHINVGSDTEPEQLRILGRIAGECDEWGMPLLAMVYPRGRTIKDQFNVEVVKHAARIGAELGADIVKTNYTGSRETFEEVVVGCPVPVVMAGGPKTQSNKEFCKTVYDSIQAGGMGVAVGRNVFQHENPTAMVKAISAIVHKNARVEEALKILGDGLK